MDQYKEAMEAETLAIAVQEAAHNFSRKEQSKEKIRVWQWLRFRVLKTNCDAA